MLGLDRPPRGGCVRLHQHVHSGHVPMLHPERLNGSRDPLEILASHRDIDIAREAPGIRHRFFYVEIDCEAADHAVFQPGGSERRFHPSCQVKELFHAFLEKRIDVKRHGVPFRMIASAAADPLSNSRGALKRPFHRLRKPLNHGEVGANRAQRFRPAEFPLL